jgi:hypothetical protein
MSTSTRAGTSAATKVVGFAAVLTVVFGGAWAAGAQVGPIGSTADQDSANHGGGHSTGPSAGADTHRSEHAKRQEDDMKNTATTGSGALPGLTVAQDGYRLVLADTTLEPGARGVAVTIEGPNGRPVTAFDVEHEKRLHLIVVRRDYAGFQHLHPTLDETTGTWTAQAELTPGTWRVFADFTAADGPALVLGSDLLVPGHLQAPNPAEETRTDVVDGYTVTVDGTLEPGEHSALTLRVTKDGVPVTDLQPYLGAYGHLVALREGDLAYLHVHPSGQPGDGATQPGPEIEFGAEVPSTGRYHLYLDFQHDDVVRTAHLILDAGRVVNSDTEPSSGSGHGDTDHTH